MGREEWGCGWDVVFSHRQSRVHLLPHLLP